MQSSEGVHHAERAGLYVSISMAPKTVAEDDEDIVYE
jgi:hypothetical protein